MIALLHTELVKMLNYTFKKLTIMIGYFFVLLLTNAEECDIIIKDIS